MNNEVYCEIPLFARQVKIHDESTSYSSNLEDLPESLVEFCVLRNKKIIHLYGNKEYIQPVVDEVKVYCKTTYSNKEIEIKIN